MTHINPNEVQITFRIYESKDARKQVFGVSDQVRTNPAVQSQKMANLQFNIKVVEGL